MRYCFEDAVLDTATFELRVGDEVVPVEPQVFEVLVYLVKHRDRLVPRAELLDAVWGDRFVSDSALASRVAAARAAIGDDGRAQRCIRTVHGRGLQFVAPVIVELESGQHDAPDAVGDLPQVVRFAHASDGAQLAVATAGHGPPLVKAANWLTHVELDWRSPVWRHWNDALASRFRYIRYDARGCGLSDRDLSGSDLTDLDLWVDDLATVVAASDVDRFALLGVSQGAAPAMAYAVRHPDRVSHLILYGAYLRGMRRRDEATRLRAETFRTLMREGWGGANPAFRSVFTTTFMPDASSEQMRWFNDLQVQTADSDCAMQLESAFYDHDFTELAARSRCPPSSSTAGGTWRRRTKRAERSHRPSRARSSSRWTAGTTSSSSRSRPGRSSSVTSTASRPADRRTAGRPGRSGPQRAASISAPSCSRRSRLILSRRSGKSSSSSSPA